MLGGYSWLQGRPCCPASPACDGVNGPTKERLRVLCQSRHFVRRGCLAGAAQRVQQPRTVSTQRERAQCGPPRESGAMSSPLRGSHPKPRGHVHTCVEMWFLHQIITTRQAPLADVEEAEVIFSTGTTSRRTRSCADRHTYILCASCRLCCSPSPSPTI
jgi:hypothetical protein